MSRLAYIYERGTTTVVATVPNLGIWTPVSASFYDLEDVLGAGGRRGEDLPVGHPYGGGAHCWIVGDKTYVISAVKLEPQTPAGKEMRTDLDKATAALVYGSIPKYRNSDRCPKPGCARTMYFKQMHLVCDVHGYPHGA